MAKAATVVVGIRGPVDKAGNSDLRGEFYSIALTFPDDELVRGKLTIGQLIVLRGVLEHFITRANLLEFGEMLTKGESE